MSKFSSLIGEIKQKRDEMRVQVELGSMELRDEWKALEARLADLDAKAAMDGAGEAIDGIGEEIRERYEKIKKALEDAAE